MASRPVEMAVLVLPGAFASGVAMMADCHALTVERGNRLIGGDAGATTVSPLSILSADGADVALSTHLMLRVDRAISAVDRLDFLWLPAFRVGGVEPLRDRLASAGPLLAWLESMAGAGTVIGASGASALLLAAAGLTRGMRVPVAPTLMPIARALLPHIGYSVEHGLMDRGSVHLSSGPAHDLELLSSVLGKLLSPYAVNWFRTALGAPLPRPDQDCFDPLVAAARLHIEQRFIHNVSIIALARELGTTHGSLLRRFRQTTGETPSAYLRSLRLETAKRLLRGTAYPVETVSAMVGFSDPRLFRAMFRQQTGTTASQWRRQHRTPGTASRRSVDQLS